MGSPEAAVEVAAGAPREDGSVGAGAMIGWLRRRLARHVDEDRIRATIEVAEAHTTGRIRVALAPRFWGSARTGAEHAFKRFRMGSLPQRNGVLFFVIPSRREFVVLGDAGIHEKVGQTFWDRVVASMKAEIKAGDLTSGLIHGITEAGKELALHFPRTEIEHKV